MAVDKPPALLVHRSGLDAGETRFAVDLLREQLGRPVWTVHRLDKPTSGLLLFALDVDTARSLAQAFEAGAVQRHYLAVVRGWPAAEGLIDHPLRRLADDQRSARGLAEQPARTRLAPLQRYALPLPYGDFAQTRCALVALQPETGRRHQLRRHCRHISHPIIGDSTHGKGPLNRDLAALLGVRRLWLHAQALELAHPAHGRPLHLKAPPDDSWSRWSKLARPPVDS